MEIIKAAAKNKKVNKIFVNPAIKVWMCENEGPLDRKWLMKVRPEKGHRESQPERGPGVAGAVSARDLNCAAAEW